MTIKDDVLKLKDEQEKAKEYFFFDSTVSALSFEKSDIAYDFKAHAMQREVDGEVTKGFAIYAFKDHGDGVKETIVFESENVREGAIL